MLLFRNDRWYSAFASSPLLCKLSDRSSGALPLRKQSAGRRCSIRTPQHNFELRARAGARCNSSVAASSRTSSSPDAQSTVNNPFTILFCGRDLFSCTVFKEVYNAKDVWEDLHIVTNPDMRAGRRWSRLDISPLKMAGESLGVPVHTIPENKAAFKKWLPPPPFTPHPSSSDFQIASHLLVTASFGRILPATFLRLFPDTRRLNVHPSMLPAYRGPAPIQRALIAGERDTGVSVMEMGEVNRREGKLVDAGRIWAVEKMNIPGDANFLHMQEALAVSGGKLLVNVLRDMLLGRAQSRPQEAVTSTTAHAPLITARDSTVDFASQTALAITRLERGIGHQRRLTVPGALPDGRGVTMAGSQATPTEVVPEALRAECPGIAFYSPETRSLVVKCAEGTWLSIKRLQTQDRVMLEAKEWWNGVKGMGWVEEGKSFRFKLGRPINPS